ncbi:MAG: GNAT family N-acetyltransferase, partial [bacterium]
MSADRPIGIDLDLRLQEVFHLDQRISASTSELEPLPTPEKLYHFYRIEHKADLFGYECDEVPVAYIALQMVDNRVLEVLNLGTDPSHQGHGYGKRLMLFAEEVARERRMNSIILYTTTTNPAAAFYRSLGYTET